jgi:hypothetical protein
LGDTTANELLIAATASANDAQMLCEDLAQQMFPRAMRAPSEAMQAAARLVLQKLVAGVERGLGVGNDGFVPKSWDILCRSGLLREATLLEFALARQAEEQISQRIDVSGATLFAQLPSRLIESDDPAIAECARNLLIAENAAQSRAPDVLVKQLPADLLHLLVWRVVAVFQASEDEASHRFISAGNLLLSTHDEANAAHAAAAKLVYFLPEAERGALGDPRAGGLTLYASGLAHEFRISHDRILRFIDEEPSAPLLLMLRARGHDPKFAMSVLQYLRGQRVDDHRLPEMLNQFERLSQETARSEILCWRLGATPVWKAG